MFHLDARECVADGRLVQLLPERAEETSPVYGATHFAADLSAKIRAFVDYVVSVMLG